MARIARTVLHGILLGMLVAGTIYGIAMLAGYVIMLIRALGGWMPMADVTASQVALGLLMVTLWGSIIMAGLVALTRQGRQTIRLSRWVASSGLPASPYTSRAAGRAGLTSNVSEVRDATPYAFTHGIWRPRVAVSTGLVAAATADELVAVLRHEASHVRNRDPLKVLALRTWAAAFFLIPVVGTVLHRILDRQELSADRAALRGAGVAPVVGALLKVAGEPPVRPSETAMAAMGGPALLEARVAQLETGRGAGLLAALRPSTVLASLPGLGVIAVYGVLLYQVCIAVELCCMS